MDRKTKVQNISIVGFIIIFSTFATILIIDYLDSKKEVLHLEFIPKEMKSYRMVTFRYKDKNQ
jgi:hypothetical protein